MKAAGPPSREGLGEVWGRFVHATAGSLLIVETLYRSAAEHLSGDRSPSIK
jgi:hypothetical protein